MVPGGSQMMCGVPDSVDPEHDPRTDRGFQGERAARHNGHADFLRERIDGRVGQ